MVYFLATETVALLSAIGRANKMWFKKKLMPDLPIYHEADGSVFPELTLRKIPSVANEIANVLAKERL